jgi:hypothetical protein
MSSPSGSTTTTGEPPSEHIRFSLQRVTTEIDASPRNPVLSKDYVKARIEGGMEDLNRYNHHLYYENVYAYDAMLTGWVLSPPFEFSVEETDDGSYTVVSEHINDGNDIVEIVDVDGDTMLSVNTLWNVEFPEGYTALLLEPFTHTTTPDQNGVAPQELSGETDTHAVTVLLDIDSPFSMTPRDALVQLIPIEQDELSASYRPADDEELTAIAKEQREQEIYPDTYGKEREQKRWGDVLDIIE